MKQRPPASCAMEHKPLTARQLAFVEEYVCSRNATQAAIRAGYSPKTARIIGAQNLSKPNIRREVRLRVDAVSIAMSIRAEDVLHELQKVAFANISDVIEIDVDGQPFVDPAKLSTNNLAGVAKIELTERVLRDGTVRRRFSVRMENRTQALTRLAKHLGLLDQRKV